ncbi:SpoIID/LytB domain-containing protein [bacterium]|nr:MAG: SpoIID/LytB domain-containing protein [bacterium]
MVKKIAFICVIMAAVTGNTFAAEEPVRVAIARDVTSTYLMVKGSFEVRDMDNNRLVYKGRNLKKSLIGLSDNRISFPYLKKGVSGRLQITPLSGGYVSVNKRSYRGKINLIALDGRLLVVNELGLEDYLRGVISNEVAHYWPMEALKAQAIIARTYALYQKQFTKNKYFDLTSDVYSQVYGGRPAQRWRTNRAVDLTRAKVLTFQGNLFPTYYHATCAGKTEDSLELWKIDLASLKGVVCGFCADSPHFRWQAKIDLGQMKDKLVKKGFSIVDISGVEITRLSASGRVSALKIQGENAGIEITAKDFRQALGPDVIRSLNFTIRVISGIAYIDGLGWGHGVGLCQWGMYKMARNGYKHAQILEYYFPQSKLVARK